MGRLLATRKPGCILPAAAASHQGGEATGGGPCENVRIPATALRSARNRPEADRAVGTAGGERAAVRREHVRGHLLAVAGRAGFERAARLFLRHVPEDHLGIGAAGGQRLAVRRECELLDLV